jgi:hypothetical protein
MDDALADTLAPSLPHGDDAALSWVPTRRWLIEPTGTAPWSIEERQFPDGPSLFFVNDEGFVRVRDYPRNWIDLPEAALGELLRHPRKIPHSG